MLERILETIEKVGSRVGSMVDNKIANLTDNQQLTIESMQADAKISAVALSKIVGISKRRMWRS